MENVKSGGAATTASPSQKPKNARPYLQNKRIAIEPVPSNMNWKGIVKNFMEKSKESFSYKGVQKSWDLPLQARHLGGGIPQILDDREKKYVSKYDEELTEKEFFERELGVDLNHTLPDESNFWRTDKNRRNKVTIFAGEIKVLDLRIPMDMLHYKILKANRNTFIEGWDNYEEKKINTILFVLADIEDKQSSAEKIADQKAKAWAIYNELIQSESRMKDFFRAKGERRSLKDTSQALKGSLVSLLNTESGYKEILKVMEDPNYEHKVLLMQFLEVGAIKFVNKEYQTESGNVLGGITSTITWLKDPMNAEAVERLKIRL